MPLTKPVWAAAALAALCAAGVAGTAAYRTAVHRTRNVITTGGVHIALHETYDSGGKTADWPLAAGLAGLVPGQTVSKVVYVTNTGQSPAWVGVRVHTALTLADGNAADPAGLVRTVGPGAGTDAYNTAAWLYDAAADRYCYRTPLQPGASTPPLFTGVALSDRMDRRCAGAAVTVTVGAMAVQSKNNGTGPTLAAGWPAAG